MPRSTKITGRVVAITGGGRGIGLATARALHQAGARVAIGDVDPAAAVAAAESIGSDVLGAGMDVTDSASFGSFLDLVERELGPIDVLVNNAGIMPIGPQLEETEATARRVFDVNVHGCLNGMKLALPGMLDRGRGHIVNVASVAGKSPVPGGASYCASKAAIVSLTETARIEHGGGGVRFTCVMPSFTATELISGTKGVRFIKNVEPDGVAKAIVRAVARPRADVYVPGSTALILRLQALTGRRLRDATNRLLGVDRAFLDVDRATRAAYETRIAAAPPRTPADDAEQSRGEPATTRS
jgi:NAD(P)-dependent dehydrogenase (short-subunit alcohol dehydrogenase family)